MTLGVGHDRGIDKTQVEILELGINLGCTPYQTLGHEIDSMFAPGHSTQKGAPCVAVNPRAEQLIHFNDDGIQHDKLSPQLGH